MNHLCRHPGCDREVFADIETMVALGPEGNLMRPWFCGNTCKASFIAEHLTMECRRCGAEIEHTTRCPNCGINIDMERPVALEQYAEQYDEGQCTNCGLGIGDHGPGEVMCGMTDADDDTYDFCGANCRTEFKEKNRLP